MVQKNAPTLAGYNYDPVQSILIIFSKLFVNDHKSCLVVKTRPLMSQLLACPTTGDITIVHVSDGFYDSERPKTPNRK